MRIYLDTSAAAKVLVDEAESEALTAYLDDVRSNTEIVSSALLETELRRLAGRLGLDQSAVSDLLTRIDLIDPSRSIFHEAGVLPGPTLRSLDALHLATALRIEADVVVAYDLRLLDAARDLGLAIDSPA
ncbi:type II toxin-antitoxin system VapC family toxin [Microcella alkalica]|uniref:type II toxin-antitoxin system VapC family toxin n=1 Tax=Microcella alkalica TaxID=355930 RepID=UPI00145F1D0D|nr:type II toxin-antitoxin system VapC family toxin [Microcella alkalica]